MVWRMLYFGDLGGQGFRVDINNAKDTDVFAPRVVTLFKEAPEGQLKPRFYDMPSVSDSPCRWEIFCSSCI